jgi:hypothetical protein
MASEVKTNKVSPATSTTLNVGDSGDTLALAVDAVTGFNVGSDAAGDVLYNDGTDYTRLAKPGTPADEVLTFATGATAPSWVAAASATLAPAFSVYRGTATTTISDAVETKVILDTEAFDSNSAFDPTTNYRFTVPAGEGGKYLISAGIQFLASGNVRNAQCVVKKDGSEVGSGVWAPTASGSSMVVYYFFINGAWMLNVAEAEYIELFIYLDVDAGIVQYNGHATAQRTWMSGFKLVGI